MTSLAPAPPPHRPLLRLFPVLLLNLIAFGIAIPILPALCEGFGGGSVELGLLFTLQATGQLLMAPRWGRLSDRLGRRPVLLLTLLCAVGVDLWTASVGSLEWLYIARFVAGLAAGNVATASAYIADVTTLKERSKGMALVGICFGLGFTIGPGIGALVSHLAPDQMGPLGKGMPFLVSAAFNGAALLAGAALLREATARAAEREAHRAQSKGGGISVRELFEREGVMRLFRFLLGYALAVTILETTFYYYVSQRYGYDERQVGMIFAGMGLLAAAVQGRVGKISARLGDERMTALGGALLGAGLVVATLIEQLPFLLVWLAVAAIGRALAQPGAMALMSAEARGEQESGALMGVVQGANSAGRIIGPLLGGVLFKHVTPRAPFIAAGALVLVSVLVWRLSSARAASHRRDERAG